MIARHAVQQQRGDHEAGQVGQAEHKHGEPHRSPAGERGQRVDRSRERPVDRGRSRPVLHRPGDGVTEGGELGRRRRVRVVAGDEHPAVRGVAEMIRRPEGRYQRQRGGRQQSSDQHGPRRGRPAAAHRPQHEYQPERSRGQPGRGQRDREIRRRVQVKRPWWLPGPAGQRWLHDRRPGHRDGEREHHAGADGDEPRPAHQPPRSRGASGPRPPGHRRTASALATSVSW